MILNWSLFLQVFIRPLSGSCLRTTDSSRTTPSWTSGTPEGRNLRIFQTNTNLSEKCDVSIKITKQTCGKFRDDPWWNWLTISPVLHSPDHRYPKRCRDDKHSQEINPPGLMWSHSRPKRASTTGMRTIITYIVVTKSLKVEVNWLEFIPNANRQLLTKLLTSKN